MAKCTQFALCFFILYFVYYDLKSSSRHVCQNPIEVFSIIVCCVCVFVYLPVFKEHLCWHKHSHLRRHTQPFGHIFCSFSVCSIWLLPKTNEKSCYSLNQFWKVLFSCSKRIINTASWVCVGIVHIPYVVDLIQQKRYSVQNRYDIFFILSMNHSWRYALRIFRLDDETRQDKTGDMIMIKKMYQRRGKKCFFDLDECVCVQMWVKVCAIRLKDELISEEPISLPFRHVD